jgi:hypothetical protein
MPFISDFDARTTVDPVRQMQLERDGRDGGSSGYMGFALRKADGDFHFAAKLTDAAVLSGRPPNSRTNDLAWLVWSSGLLEQPLYEPLKEVIREALLSYKHGCGMTMPGLTYQVHFEQIGEMSHG